MIISETDLQGLHALGLSGLRNILRPDTDVVYRAFDNLMAAVKVGYLKGSICLPSWSALDARGTQVHDPHASIGSISSPVRT